MHYAQQMKHTYGVSTIFLSSDSREVIRDASKYKDRFTFLTIDGGSYHSPGTMNISWDQLAARRSYKQARPTMEAFHIIAAMLLLSECDMLIGKFSSNVFRIAFQLLMSSREQCVPPYVGLDGPWCSDWGMPSGIGEGGRRYAC
jgi:hypothetical protein